MEEEIGGSLVRRIWIVLMAIAGVVTWGSSAAMGVAVNVCPTVETAPVHNSGDAADDSAIWIHPTDRSKSTVIGTDKSTAGGLNVYDLSGAEVQFKADGRLNNDDVRYNFPLGATRVDLVGATNRVARTADFYKVNADRTLTKVGAVAVALTTPRGFAFYHSPVSGKYYAFVTDVGNTLQYELDGSTGQVTGRLVRMLAATPVKHTEGLVADDELGRVYLAEEDVGGVWRYGAEPTDPTSGVKILTTTEVGGPVVQDVKGLMMYYASGGRGYVIAVSQGGSSFHVLQRGGANAYVGEFKVIACNGIDAVTGIDGADVTNAGLGPAFPQGLFVTQDDANTGGNQNHKLVPWQSIANAFNPPLVIDTTFDPRSIGAGPSGPDTSIDSGPSGTVRSRTATFTFSSPAPMATFQCALDAAAFAACASPLDLSGLADGAHTFSVRAIDVSGASDPTPASQTWTVDASPPDTTITAMPPNPSSSSSASFSFTSTESGSTFECALDGSVFTACTSPRAYSALANGPHAFQVRSTDAAGNVDPTPASYSWDVALATDVTPPTVTAVSPGDGATAVAPAANVQATFSEAMNAATITGTTFTLVRTSDGAAVPAAVSYDAGSSIATLDPTADLAASTSYTATVTTGVRDAAGNAMQAARTWSFSTAAQPPPGGGVTRQAASTAVATTAASTVTVARPAGTVQGDALVACLALNGGSVSATGAPAGWTRIAAVTTLANPHVFGYVKVAGASEPASYTWTLAGAVASGAGIGRYAGVDPATPLDTTVSAASGAAALSGAVPGVTTATPGAMLVGCMSINSSNTAVTIASPAGMTEAWDVGGKRHELADGSQAAPGPSGTKTWTFSASREWAGWVTALRPR